MRVQGLHALPGRPEKQFLRLDRGTAKGRSAPSTGLLWTVAFELPWVLGSVVSLVLLLRAVPRVVAGRAGHEAK